MEHEFLGLKVRFEGENVLVRGFGGTPTVFSVEEYLQEILSQATLAAQALREARLRDSLQRPAFPEDILKTPLRELSREVFLPKKSSQGLPSNGKLPKAR